MTNVIKQICEKDKEYHQYYAITKRFLRSLNKLLKGNKTEKRRIVEVVIIQYEDGEVHVTASHTKQA